jgi:hypothetical protein
MKQITCNFCGDTYPDFDVAHVCSKGPYAPRLKSKMNERIEKLKESACPKIDWAGRYHVELNNGEKEKWMNEWFEKFAELIVSECIEQAHGVADLRGANDDMIYGADTAAARINKHFGVKE